MCERRLIAGRDAPQRAPSVLGPQHYDAMLDLAFAAIDLGEGLDLASTARFSDELRHRASVAIGVRLYAVLLLHRFARHLPRQHEPVMLGDEAALAIEQAELCAITHLAHHRASRMRHIGVERRAEEGEPACYGRLDVGTEPQRPPCHLGHAGEAAI